MIVEAWQALTTTLNRLLYKAAVTGASWDTCLCCNSSSWLFSKRASSLEPTKSTCQEMNVLWGNLLALDAMFRLLFSVWSGLWGFCGVTCVRRLLFLLTWSLHVLTFSHSAHSAWDYGLLWICILFETVVSYDIKMTQQSLLLKDRRFGVPWQKCKTYDKNLGSSGGCLTFCFGLKQIDEISEKFLSWKFRVQLWSCTS